MRTVRRPRPAGSERFRGPCMGREPPARRRRLVDRTPDERVPEDELARHRRGAHEVELEQRVQQPEHVRRGQLGDRARQIRLEGLSRDRGSAEQRALVRRQRRELVRERRRHRGRDGHACDVDTRVGCSWDGAVLAGALELLEVEGISAGLADHDLRRTGIDLAEELGRLCVVELREPDPADGRNRERGREARRCPAGAESDREQHRSLGCALQQPGEQLDRRLVAPVEIVQHDHERPLVCEELEQPAHRAVGSVALVGNRCRGAVAARSDGRDHAGELLHELRAPAIAEVELLRGDVGVERVDPDAERQVALELRRRAGEHQAPRLLGVATKHGEQMRLADARLALHRDAGGRAGGQAVERRAQLLELELAPDGPSGARVDTHVRSTLLRSALGSGRVPDVPKAALGHAEDMPLFLLQHRHEPSECAAAYAAWTGFRSPLRHGLATSSCLAGGHALWWRVQADDAVAALALLPRFVARRTVPIEIRDVEIP